MVKIELRHFQLIDDTGTPYWWIGGTPNNITKTTNPADAVAIGFVGTYFDITNCVLNIEDIEFTFEVGENDVNIKNTLSDEIKLADDNINNIFAATFVRDWLVDRPYSPQNICEIRFTDMDCGSVIGEYLIKPQKISFCLMGDCTLSVTVVSNDILFDCIQKTKISDNWNGILNQDFRAWDYGVEKRPAVMTALFFSLFALVGVLGFGILALGTFISWILSLAGLPTPPFVPTFSDYEQMFLQIVGLGRVHPAANVAEYTDNVCGKCGVTVDTANNLFYQSTIPLYAGGSIPNPYLNMDLIFAQNEKGRKRTDPNKRKLIDYNIPIIGLSDLYTDLAKMFNAKWYLVNGKLRFMVKQAFATLLPIIDFSTYNQDRILDICIDVTDNIPPLTVDYGYQDDAVDLLSRDVRPRYSSKASYDADDTPNPNLKGNINREVPFGASRFMDDDRTNGYIDDATNSPLVYLAVYSIVFLLFIYLIFALADIASLTPSAVISIIVAGAIILMIGLAFVYIGASIYLDATLGNVLIMSQDVASLPKPIIWDGVDVDSARSPGIMSNATTPNPLFNPALNSYDTVHTENEIQPSNLRNYDMFFDTKFKSNIYDYFWSWQDNRVNAITKRDVRVIFVACCEDLNTLGVYQSQEIAIDKKAKYPQVYYTGAIAVTDEFRIEKIVVNFTTKKVSLSGTNFN